MDFLDQFNLPGVASQDIKARNMRLNPAGDGVSFLGASSEFAGGLPFRFFVHADYDDFGSKQAKFQKYNNIDMIEWTVDKKLKPVAMVKHLPPELLEFEVIGYKEVPASANPNLTNDPYAHPIYGEECIGGVMKEAYDRFKNGLNSPGLPISKWGVLDDASIATLSHYGIFSVEQFAARPRAWVMNGSFPKNMQEAWERACFYVNGADQRMKDDALAEQLKKIAMEAAQKDDLIVQMREQMSRMEAMFAERAESKPKKAPRVKKVKEEEQES